MMITIVPALLALALLAATGDARVFFGRSTPSNVCHANAALNSTERLLASPPPLSRLPASAATVPTSRFSLAVFHIFVEFLIEQQRLLECGPRG